MEQPGFELSDSFGAPPSARGGVATIESGGVADAEMDVEGGLGPSSSVEGSERTWLGADRGGGWLNETEGLLSLRVSELDRDGEGVDCPTCGLGDFVAETDERLVLIGRLSFP